MRLSPPGLILLSAAVLIALPASAVDLPEIQARGSLRVIAAEGEQPEMFDFDGDPAKPGLEREMLEGFAGLKRLKLEVVPVKAFADRIPALLRGDGDVIVGLVDTAERRKQIDFTAEVLPVRHLVVTHKPAPPVKSVEEFRKKKVGTIRGTTWARETLAAGVPESQVRVLPGHGAACSALAAGRVDAAVMTISDFTLAWLGTPGSRPARSSARPSRAAWGVRKQDVEAEGGARRLHRQPAQRRLLEPARRHLLRREGAHRPGTQVAAGVGPMKTPHGAVRACRPLAGVAPPSREGPRSPAAPSGATATHPLRVAADGRHLLRADGRPFFYLADTAWSLFHRLTREEADLYLRNRAAKGFTVIQAVALSENDGLRTPNAYGERPLARDDPRRPNEALLRARRLGRRPRGGAGPDRRAAAHVGRQVAQPPERARAEGVHRRGHRPRLRALHRPALRRASGHLRAGRRP